MEDYKTGYVPNLSARLQNTSPLAGSSQRIAFEFTLGATATAEFNAQLNNNYFYTLALSMNGVTGAGSGNLRYRGVAVDDYVWYYGPSTACTLMGYNHVFQGDSIWLAFRMYSPDFQTNHQFTFLWDGSSDSFSALTQEFEIIEI